MSMPCSLPRALSATNRESGQQEELDDKRRPDPHLEAQDADLSHGAAEGRVVFSVDNSVHLPARSTKARKALSQYISRPPLSSKKMSIQENVQLPHSGNCLADSPRADRHGAANVNSYTSDNEFFQGKTETFSLTRFFLEVTQARPPAGITIYPAIWALCFQNQGQVAGYASCGPPRSHRVEGANRRKLPRRWPPPSNNPPLRSPTGKPVRHGPSSSLRFTKLTR